MPRCRSHNFAICLRSKSMPPVLLSNRIKSFPAPFILVKRNMIVIVAAATPLVMSSGYPHPIIVAVILSEAERSRRIPRDDHGVPRDGKLGRVPKAFGAALQ